MISIVEACFSTRKGHTVRQSLSARQNLAQSRIRLDPPLLPEALKDARRARDINGYSLQSVAS